MDLFSVTVGLGLMVVVLFAWGFDVVRYRLKNKEPEPWRWCCFFFVSLMGPATAAGLLALAYHFSKGQLLIAMFAGFAVGCILFLYPTRPENKRKQLHNN